MSFTYGCRANKLKIKQSVITSEWVHRQDKVALASLTGILANRACALSEKTNFSHKNRIP
jgi:hypothetical protein